MASSAWSLFIYLCWKTCKAYCCDKCIYRPQQVARVAEAEDIPELQFTESLRRVRSKILFAVLRVTTRRLVRWHPRNDWSLRMGSERVSLFLRSSCASEPISLDPIPITTAGIASLYFQVACPQVGCGVLISRYQNRYFLEGFTSVSTTAPAPLFF